MDRFVNVFLGPSTSAHYRLGGAPCVVAPPLFLRLPSVSAGVQTRVASSLPAELPPLFNPVLFWIGPGCLWVSRVVICYCLSGEKLFCFVWGGASVISRAPRTGFMLVACGVCVGTGANMLPT